MRVAVVGGLDTRELRRTVLRPSWPRGSLMHGDDDPRAVHLGAFDGNGTLVGACLLLPNADPDRPDAPGDWQLRGMATADGYRSRGVGAAVLAAAVDEVVRRGGRTLWCNARTSAMAFYRHHGFLVDGPEFLHTESGIPHHRMYRTP